MGISSAAPTIMGIRLEHDSVAAAAAAQPQGKQRSYDASIARSSGESSSVSFVISAGCICRKQRKLSRLLRLAIGCRVAEL